MSQFFKRAQAIATACLIALGSNVFADETTTAPPAVETPAAKAPATALLPAVMARPEETPVVVTQPAPQSQPALLARPQEGQVIIMQPAPLPNMSSQPAPFQVDPNA